MQSKIRILICLCVFLPVMTFATQIDKIVVFGDSLSDSGNDYKTLAYFNKLDPKIPVIPVSPPYDKRFSNGKVWAEDLLKYMNLDTKAHHGQYQFDDLAYGGAWVEPASVSKQKTFPPDLAMEIWQYTYVDSVMQDDTDKSKHLFVVWMGSNDYLSGRNDVQKATSNTINLIQSAIVDLYNLGARYFLIPNIPDVPATPYAKSLSTDMQHNLAELTNVHNSKLAAMIAELRSSYPDAVFIEFNSYDFVHQLIANPDMARSKYALTDLTTPCYQGSYSNQTAAVSDDTELALSHKVGIDLAKNVTLRLAAETSKYSLAALQSMVCADPAKHLFWDALHPTGHVHQILAQNMCQELVANGIQANCQ